MPVPRRHLTRADLVRHVDEHVFGGPSNDSVGIELEWLTAVGSDGRRPSETELDLLCRWAEPRLPRQGRLSFEPGGQLELSTRPFPTAERACEAAATDLFHFEQLAKAREIALIALGSDPARPPERITTAPRYRSMERYFGLQGSDGVRMMANSASIQLNVGLGADESHLRSRWQLANRLGPVLIAAFANSPLEDGRATGWQSSRLRSWWRIDPTRTAPVPLGDEPRSAWLRYALEANVMMIRVRDDSYEPLDRPFPFERWLDNGHESGWPTIDDFAYHLTTLFPPVRPRGWLELRVFDALPTPFWHVAVAVTTALLDDDDTAAAALRAVDGTEHLWADAAQLALGHPELEAAARACFELALEHIGATSPDSATEAVLGTYYERWVSKARSPSLDRIDGWRDSGNPFPVAESPIRYVDFERVAT